MPLGEYRPCIQTPQSIWRCASPDTHEGAFHLAHGPRHQACGGIQCLWGSIGLVDGHPNPNGAALHPTHTNLRFTCPVVRITTHVEVFNAHGGVSAL